LSTATGASAGFDGITELDVDIGFGVGARLTFFIDNAPKILYWQPVWAAFKVHMDYKSDGSWDAIFTGQDKDKTQVRMQVVPAKTIEY